MIANMRQVYAAARITVNILATKILNLLLLNDLDVGGCNGQAD